jgi:hypothetical protein
VPVVLKYDSLLLFKSCRSGLSFTFFHTHTVHLDIKVFYSPTDAQENCLKNNFKIYIKMTLKQLQHVSVQSPSSESALFELAKVTVVKIIN